MIGMILCGSYSKQSQPIVKDTPNVLLELKDNYAILDKQLLSYKSAGFDRVFLHTDHLSNKIRPKCGDVYKGLEIEYIAEKKPLGTLDAIRLGLEKAGEDIIVSNGNVVTDINLKRMKEEFIRLCPQALILIRLMRNSYDIMRFKGKHIESFGEKHKMGYFINGGYYCLSRNILSMLGEFKTGNIEKMVFQELAARGQLVYYKEKGDYFWAKIDVMKDMEKIRKEYSNRTDKPWGHEKLLKLTNERMEKLLFIMTSYRTSVHYHKVKDETFYVLRCTGWIEFEDGKRRQFRRRTKIRIKPGVIHSTLASEDTVIHEISTPHPEDVVRVKDFYETR